MRELFRIDKQNYKKGGTVGRRPSVRGIIIRDGLITMVHSLKYNYYKLPGGGIEHGETLEETLIREVTEETGLVIKPSSIMEFGYVRRIEKGNVDDIFIQDNYYFLCEPEQRQESQNLDDYENEEQFTLEFVTPSHAIEVNETADHKEKKNIRTFMTMLERENRVLKLVTEELY